jgi:hypothetical protein
MRKHFNAAHAIAQLTQDLKAAVKSRDRAAIHPIGESLFARGGYSALEKAWGALDRRDQLGLAIVNSAWNGIGRTNDDLGWLS